MCQVRRQVVSLGIAQRRNLDIAQRRNLDMVSSSCAMIQRSLDPSPVYPSGAPVGQTPYGAPQPGYGAPGEIDTDSLVVFMLMITTLPQASPASAPRHTPAVLRVQPTPRRSPDTLSQAHPPQPIPRKPLGTRPKACHQLATRRRAHSLGMPLRRPHLYATDVYLVP